MRFGRGLSGPALTTATAAAAILVDRNFIAIPDPAPLLIGLVAFAALLGGLASGMASAVIAIVACALFSLGHGAVPGEQPADQIRLVMLAIAATGTASMSGLMRKMIIDGFAGERRHRATAERLSAALDEIDIGIVLLDAETRAEFINRAFRKYFSLPDAKADRKPPFVALMYHGRDAGAFRLPREELSTFIAERIEMMRSGDSTPIDIEMADGQVLRFSCTALPDGGRMLSYIPVTDLIRHTDDPTRADYFQSLRGAGNRELTPHLRAAE